MVACAQELVYRHIAWTNALRLQLRGEVPWDELRAFLDSEDYQWTIERKNRATQLVQQQRLGLAEGTKGGFIVYVLMRVGEFNADPFESQFSDTPMTALYRAIEIDRREQLGESDPPREAGTGRRNSHAGTLS